MEGVPLLRSFFKSLKIDFGLILFSYMLICVINDPRAKYQLWYGLRP